LAESTNIDNEWVGRLVRVLLVFRALVLLITILVLPATERRPIVAPAVILAAVITYVPLRHWSAIAASVARHPVYLALEVALATLILSAAGARSPFFYFTLGTAAIAGIVYGRRGAIPFSALLMAAYELVALEGLPNMHRLHDAQSVVFAPLLYPAAVCAGIAARELIERGIRSEALLREHTEALAAERERVRVARELHDSLAKTVEGLAMTASILPRRCERDPSAAAALARALAQDARRAAAEARGLMSDLRLGSGERSFLEDLRRCADAVARRNGLSVGVSGPPTGTETSWDALSAQSRHEVLRIVSEALLNAERHAGATAAAVWLGAEDEELVLRVSDDGSGLPEPLDLERLKADGHFGLAGMHERARAIDGRLTVEAGGEAGTVVSLRLPVPEAALAAELAPVASPPDLGNGRTRLLSALYRRPRSARLRA
jgi:signal transduction histidine kinase